VGLAGHVEPTVGDGLAGGHQSEEGETVHAPGVPAVEMLRRVEVDHLGGDTHRQVGGVEGADGAHP